jgi:hypothetical protein
MGGARGGIMKVARGLVLTKLFCGFHFRRDLMENPNQHENVVIWSCLEHSDLDRR